MKLNASVSFRQTEPNIGLLVDADGASICAVNGAGVALWKTMAKGDATRADLVAALKSIFVALPSDEKIERDVDAFLDELRTKGFLAQDETDAALSGAER